MKELNLKLLGNMPAKELQVACCPQTALNTRTSRGMLRHPQQRLLAQAPLNHDQTPPTPHPPLFPFIKT